MKRVCLTAMFIGMLNVSPLAVEANTVKEPIKLVRIDGQWYKIQNGQKFAFFGALIKFVVAPIAKAMLDNVKEAVIDWAKEAAIKLVSSDNNNPNIETITLHVTKKGLVAYCEDHDGNGHLDNKEIEMLDNPNDENEIDEDVASLLSAEIKYVDQFYDGDIDHDGEDGYVNDDEDEDDNDEDIEIEDEDGDDGE